MKRCFRCNTEKPLEDYYKHKGMSDGYLNKCKKYTILDSAKRTEIITSTPEGIEKERKRHRDKYANLNYREKQKEWDKDRPWKNTSKYKNLNRNFKIEKGFEIHHWNYNDEFLEDFIVLQTKQHKQAHSYLVFDKETLVFKAKDKNIVLDTKEKHIAFLKIKGIQF